MLAEFALNAMEELAAAGASFRAEGGPFADRRRKAGSYAGKTQMRETGSVENVSQQQQKADLPFDEGPTASDRASYARMAAWRCAVMNLPIVFSENRVRFSGRCAGSLPVCNNGDG